MPLVEVADKDGAVNAQAVDELEIEFPTMLEIRRGKSDFFFRLTNGGLLNGFPFVDLATRAIDLALTKTSFLAYKEHFVLAPHKYQHGPHLGGPIVPIDVDSRLVRHALPLRTNRFRSKHKPESQLPRMIKFSV